VKRRRREHEAPIGDNISALSGTPSAPARTLDQISMPSTTSSSLIATPSLSTTSLLDASNPDFDMQAANINQQLLGLQGDIQLMAGELTHCPFIIIICNFYTGASRKAPHTAADDFDIHGLDTNPFLSYDFTEQLTPGLDVLDTTNGPLSLLSPGYSLPQF